MIRLSFSILIQTHRQTQTDTQIDTQTIYLCKSPFLTALFFKVLYNFSATGKRFVSLAMADSSENYGQSCATVPDADTVVPLLSDLPECKTKWP